MLEDIELHEKREHWTLMNRNDIHAGAKKIMAICSFNRKRYPDGSLNKQKARLCANGGQKSGVKTIGILMHRSSHGLVYNYY